MHINGDRRTGLAQMRGPFAIQSVLAVQSDKWHFAGTDETDARPGVYLGIAAYLSSSVLRLLVKEAAKAL